MQVEVIEGWTASYTNPVRVRAGEALVLDGREDLWDGHRWLWARGPDGREGWVPDSLVAPDGTASRDYSALELTCDAGERLEAVEERHGWVLCRNAEGEGWVPVRNLRKIEAGRPAAG